MTWQRPTRLRYREAERPSWTRDYRILRAHIRIAKLDRDEALLGTLRSLLEPTPTTDTPHAT